MAVCSTSNERAVQKIVDVLIGGEAGKRIRVYAGDVVPRKKPDPAIYLLAAEELGVEPDRHAVTASIPAAKHWLHLLGFFARSRPSIARRLHSKL